MECPVPLKGKLYAVVFAYFYRTKTVALSLLELGILPLHYSPPARFFTPIEDHVSILGFSIYMHIWSSSIVSLFIQHPGYPQYDPSSLPNAAPTITPPQNISKSTYTDKSNSSNTTGNKFLAALPTLPSVLHASTSSPSPLTLFLNGDSSHS